MATIYQERFDVGPHIKQRTVGRSAYHRPCYPPMGEHDLFFCGISSGKDTFEVERIDAPFHALLFCVEGEFELYEDGRSMALRAGELGVLPPVGRRGFRLVGNRPCKVVWFLLMDRPRWQFLPREQITIIASDAGPTLLDAASLFHREADRFHLNTPGTQVVAVLDLLMMMLERALAPLHPTLGWPEQLQALFNTVAQRLDEHWSLERLAEHLHITPAHLHRLCRQHLGNAPAQQLFLLRMNRARALLQQGDKVSDVALAVGYQEVASFSRRFRQHFGVSPSSVQRPTQRYGQPASPSPSLRPVDAGYG
ncbi:AraC-type DNA-binding protein [Andreprevotia lacus DSM 23236]|jgi:AraC-like DNA-binding protein|uniref:AraC-type DNA-binding protein n=1 Tax=Andreprevotia lacus DSM 23236 TaxID=1121001 RepID=A0A1W1Y0M5_9NEIS|nr:helix-turn-helix domain-containing protein [Andreprevotia lacus]SMC29695.1 AraC-type DNA-binding protein [Andreprevotia lacus DSM 23236]